MSETILQARTKGRQVTVVMKDKPLPIAGIAQRGKKFVY